MELRDIETTAYQLQKQIEAIENDNLKFRVELTLFKDREWSCDETSFNFELINQSINFDISIIEKDLYEIFLLKYKQRYKANLEKVQMDLDRVRSLVEASSENILPSTNNVINFLGDHNATIN